MRPTLTDSAEVTLTLKPGRDKSKCGGQEVGRMKSSSWAERFVENIQQRHRKTGKAGAVRGRPPHSDITKKKNTQKKKHQLFVYGRKSHFPQPPQVKTQGAHILPCTGHTLTSPKNNVMQEKIREETDSLSRSAICDKLQG